MAGSTGLRLASGLFLFVVLARVMGAAQFGILMTWFSVGALCALPSNFGLSLFFLREASRSEDRGADLIDHIFGLKICIVIGTAFLMAIASFAPQVNIQLLWPLFFMNAFESFTDIFCAQLRVYGAYHLETAFVTKQAFLQFVIVAGIALTLQTPVSIALGFAISRLISLCVAAFEVRQVSGKLPKPIFSETTHIAKKSVGYFADFGFQSALIQVDVVLLSIFSGTTAVGVYQAGMRIVHGVSQLITVMVNVLLPRLSRQLLKEKLGWQVSGKIVGVFVFAGLCFGTPLYFGADLIAPLLYGTAFPSLPSVLKVLALFLLVRFSGAAAGVLLIASGEQTRRAIVMALALCVLCATAAYLMPHFGAVGAALAMCITYLFIAACLSGVLILRFKTQ